jgi:replication factor C subunit 3/5
MAMLWVDKYRPKTLEDMDYHKELSDRLKRMADSGNQPHMLFVGPSGAGKATRVLGLLRELYGQGAEAVKVETRTVAPNPNTPSSTVDIQVIVSNYHLQLTPSDVGNKDRSVVMQLIKEVAAHPPLGGRPFKVVVIEEAGSLSTEAQAALRRTMERYMKTCRLILTCESASKIIPPLRSRCLAIRVPAPTPEQIQTALVKVAAAEKFALSPELAGKIAVKSDRDLRRALLIMESVAIQSAAPTKEMQLPQEPWELAITRVSTMMLQEQTPRMALEVRGRLYELMAACLPPDFILKELALKLVAQISKEELKQRCLQAAAHFEHTLAQGGKDIFHLEAFVTRFMADFARLK